MIDWNKPEERARLIERVGPDRYNELFAEHRRQSIVSTAGGHEIYPVVSGRFGQIFMVSGLTGFSTLAQAETWAHANPTEERGLNDEGETEADFAARKAAFRAAVGRQK